mgnify:CR=1 FL=1
MTTLRIEKVDTSLPGTLLPNTLYFVKNGTKITSYITDNTGTNAHPTDSALESSIIHPFLLMGAGNA